MNAPCLDHVSVSAHPALLGELGFRVTPTPGVETHARILLDHAYLEVTTPRSPTAGIAGRGWFLRPDDVHAAANALRRAGIMVSGPNPYAGHAGKWLDVEVEGPGGGCGLPIVTRRTDRDETVWPPALVTPHPNGATRPTELHVRPEAPETLRRALAVLGAHRDAAGRYRLGDGTLIIIGDAPDRGMGIVELVVARTGGEPLRLALHR